MYNILRYIFGVVCVVSIVVLYKTALKRKSRILTGAIALALLIIFSVLWVFPVENLFFRFSNPADSMSYSFSGANLLQVMQYGNDAVVFFDIDTTPHHVIVQRDDKGWRISSPNTVAINSSTTELSSGYSFLSMQLPNSSVCFVSVNCFYDKNNPKTNQGRSLIKTITDTNSSSFASFQYETPEIKFYYFYTFTKISNPGYHLIINGNNHSLYGND